MSAPKSSSQIAWLAPIDRASDLRSDSAKLAQLWEQAQIIQVIDSRLSATEAALTFIDAQAVELLQDSFTEGERYFLGIGRTDSQPYFAWRTSWSNPPLNDGTDDFDSRKYEGFKTLREVGGNLDIEDLTLAMHAIGLANWHSTHPCCSRCGAKTVSDLGGSVRICVEDATQHHPRTDPAVIVLIRDAQDRILLGHQPIWPEKRFSTFAGFVEPGESFEECVSREVFEEAGVYATEIKYLTSQPWPFPASIMIAFDAFTENPEAARPDGQEITEVRWFSRAEMKQAIIDGELLLPPSISVARRMIENWYISDTEYVREDLNGGEFWRP